MIRSGGKHEKIHQCTRCTELDEKDSYCISGGKDIDEPLKLRYCRRFKQKRQRKA